MKNSTVTLILIVAFLCMVVAPIMMVNSSNVPINERSATVQKFTNIKGLEDCEIFKIQSSSIVIVKCPNSSTTVNYHEVSRRY